MAKNKIEELYKEEKSKLFVNHLIQAYMPVSKPTKVFMFEDNKSIHKCNVCGHELIDAGTVMGRMMNSEEYKKDFIGHLRKEMSGKEIKREDHPIIKHVTHGAIIACTGEKTNTYLCMECIQNLLSLVTNGLLIGDKNIIYQVNKLQRNQAFSGFLEKLPNEEDKKKVEDIQKKTEESKKHKMTLGDLGVLQDLKKKMEEKEKNKIT